MVGTGVFTSLHYQVEPLPSGFVILVLWLVGGICALCGALAYGELAAALPRSGGEYHLLSKTLHPAVGFVAGWLSATVGFAAPIAVAAMAFGRYFADAFPGQSPLVLSFAVTGIVTMVHLRGVSFGTDFQNAATALKVALILVFIVAGAVAKSTTGISFTPHRGAIDLIISPSFAFNLVFVMYAYSGWNAATYIVGEVRDPAINVPRSIAFGTLIVTGLYLALNATFLRAAPMAELAEKEKIEVGYAAATHIFGDAGGRIMAGLICLGLVASISAMTWVGPRVSMVMGEDHWLLAPLARKSTRGVPAIGMLLQLAIVVVLLWKAGFDQVINFIQFSLTLCSFLTVAGLFVLRRTQPDLPRPYRTWGYPFTPLIFLTISGWMLVHIVQSKPRESLAGLATLLLGLAIYYISPKRTRVVTSDSQAC
jgi:APA family basic amino acid/polyamine antiporter